MAGEKENFFTKLFKSNAAKSKKGAVAYNKFTGEKYQISDFERGRAMGMNDMMKKQQEVYKYRKTHPKKTDS